MEKFLLTPAGVRNLRLKYFIRRIPTILIFTAFFVWFYSKKEIYRAHGVDIAPILVPCLATFVAYSVIRGLLKMNAIARSFTLELSDSAITRKMIDLPVVTINLSDITKITRTRNGMLLVLGKFGQAINVPVHMECFSKIEAVLAEYAEIRREASGAYRKTLSTFLQYTGIALMVACFLVHDRLLLVITGIPALIILTWTYLVIRRNPAIAEKFKKMIWFLTIPLAALAGRILLAMLGFPLT